MALTRTRSLALSLLALAVLATLAAGWIPATWRWPMRLAILFLLPMAAGAIATWWLPRSERRLGSSARIRGTSRFHLVIALAVVIDLAAIGVGYALGWTTLTYGDLTLKAWKGGALLLALPFTIAVATLGTEWALHSRLWEVVARQRGREPATWLVIAVGVALALPAIAPGFLAADSPYLISALAVAAIREATALALFRRGGLFVAGTYRGTLLAVDGFGLADWSSFYFPVANYVSSVPAFYFVRALGPLAALALVLAVGRKQTPAA